MQLAGKETNMVAVLKGYSRDKEAADAKIPKARGLSIDSSSVKDIASKTPGSSSPETVLENFNFGFTPSSFYPNCSAITEIESQTSAAPLKSSSSQTAVNGSDLTNNNLEDFKFDFTSANSSSFTQPLISALKPHHIAPIAPLPTRSLSLFGQSAALHIEPMLKAQHISPIAPTQSLVKKKKVYDFEQTTLSPISTLFEYCQKRRYQMSFDFSRSGPDHIPFFDCICKVADLVSNGSACNKKEAKSMACAEMLALLTR